jgi:hypothetical protein
VVSEHLHKAPFVESSGAGARLNCIDGVVEPVRLEVSAYGINHLRIPTGFWAWIPTIEGEPYLNDTSVYQEHSVIAVTIWSERV